MDLNSTLEIARHEQRVLQKLQRIYDQDNEVEVKQEEYDKLKANRKRKRTAITYTEEEKTRPIQYKVKTRLTKPPEVTPAPKPKLEANDFACQTEQPHLFDMALQTDPCRIFPQDNLMLGWPLKDKLTQQDQDNQCQLIESNPCKIYHGDDDLEDAILMDAAHPALMETIPCRKQQDEDDLEDAILNDSNDSVPTQTYPSIPDNWDLLSEELSEIDETILEISVDDQDLEYY